MRWDLTMQLWLSWKFTCFCFRSRGLKGVCRHLAMWDLLLPLRTTVELWVLLRSRGLPYHLWCVPHHPTSPTVRSVKLACALRQFLHSLGCPSTCWEFWILLPQPPKDWFMSTPNQVALHNLELFLTVISPSTTDRRKITTVYQHLQMDAIRSLLPREKPVCCHYLFDCSWWQTLVFIMGVLTLTLGLILIVYNPYQQVAFSVGICMTVASFIFIVLTRVKVLPNNENLTEELELRTESEISLCTSQTSVASTRM